MTKMVSICSAHQERVFGCPACASVYPMREDDLNDLTTCRCCGFVYYKVAAICPKCQKENL